MTYKTKSLIYFSCFVVASLVYYQIEQQDEFQEQMNSETFVEAEFQDEMEPENPQLDFEEDQKWFPFDPLLLKASQLLS